MIQLTPIAHFERNLQEIWALIQYKNVVLPVEIGNSITAKRRS